MDKNLGSIKRCDVRDVWSKEASEFTPWLASDENMTMLADALGLELEVENIEVAVGPYSADILAKDIGSGHYVVIENQLGKTNHDHLGKALTYGSVLDAGAVIWIATEFTEEHQRALEWLNDKTGDDLSFYGVQLEVWKIDGSRPAVRFNVISKPKGIIRQAAVVKANDNMTDAKRLQFEFWTKVQERLLRDKIVPSARTVRPQYWFDVALGRSGFVLSNTANTSEGRIGVRVYMHSSVADAALAELKEQKSEIERELGMSLSWNPHPEKRDKIIAVGREANLWRREEWDSAIDWLVSTIAAFRKAFIPRIKNLKLDAEE